MIQKGSKVRILRQASYWYLEQGIVTAVEKGDMIRYPYLIKFEKYNYSGVNTSSFSLEELKNVSDSFQGNN
jgi:photosystem I subunit 4